MNLSFKMIQTEYYELLMEVGENASEVQSCSRRRRRPTYKCTTALSPQQVRFIIRQDEKAFIVLLNTSCPDET
jgi:hypothetical protein